jgi:uncharacterized protein (UPF0248 family)
VAVFKPILIQPREKRMNLRVIYTDKAMQISNRKVWLTVIRAGGRKEGTGESTPQLYIKKWDVAAV